MRCITLLLFGLFSATYAAPTPPPVTCMFLTRDYALRLALAMGAPLLLRMALVNKLALKSNELFMPIMTHTLHRDKVTDNRTFTNRQDKNGLFYEVEDQASYDQQWSEQLRLTEGFKNDMVRWLKDFLEERTFKTYLGVSARTFPGTYVIFLRKHPRNTKYRIRTPQDFFVTVNPFPRWKPDFEGEVKKTPLSSDLSAKIPCTLEIDFESHTGWAIIALITDDKLEAKRRYGQTPMIWIPLTAKDESFLKRCDELVPGRTSVRFEDLPKAPPPPRWSIYPDRTWLRWTTRIMEMYTCATFLRHLFPGLPLLVPRFPGFFLLFEQSDDFDTDLSFPVSHSLFWVPFLFEQSEDFYIDRVCQLSFWVVCESEQTLPPVRWPSQVLDRPIPGRHRSTDVESFFTIRISVKYAQKQAEAPCELV
ncbi:hypothetical protein F5880DRAFT_1511776 [Lentinula raphanica]|nr:hypothetical protein F5880DRAFT_1511776 [Lentinula raphanica]